MSRKLFLSLASSGMALGILIVLSAGCDRTAAQQRPPPPSVVQLIKALGGGWSEEQIFASSQPSTRN